MQLSNLARPAGVLYLLIIVFGLTSEIAVRAPLAGLDGEALIAAIAGAELALRLSILADAAMVTFDIALAYFLFRLLSPVSQTLAGLAALFRLAQAAVIAGNLATQYEALVWAQAGKADLARHALDLHAVGYDIGLIFFGVNSLLTGILLVNSRIFARVLGWLLGAAGLVYMIGSTLRVLSPDTAEIFMPAYLVAVVAELSFAIALLRKNRQSVRVGSAELLA